MAHIEGSTVIARPVEDVFDFVADERNEPAFNPRMTRVQKLTPGPLGAGTRWSATVITRGRLVELQIEVTDYTRPTRLGSVTRMPTGEIRGALSFERDPSGTKMSWSWQVHLRGPLRVLDPLVARVGRQQEAEIWAGLKHRLEHGSAPDAAT